jgi:hypothetical protein
MSRILAMHPFPTTSEREEIARPAWKKALKVGDESFKLTHRILSIVSLYVSLHMSYHSVIDYEGGSNVRGSAATAAIAEVTSHFGFKSGGDNDVLTRNKALRNKLLKGKAFMYKVRYV